MKIKAWLRLFILAAALTVQSVLGGMASYATVYIYDEDEDEEDEEDDRLPERRIGPGETTESEIETNSVVLDSPLLNQITLKEKYHEDYKVYEESIADVFFFYSNVSNGGITHESVILDIPQNLSYTVEVNGVPWDYVSGQPISNYGTYVVRLTGIEDTNVPLYEQKEYQAVFRFRIQAKPPKDETEEEEEEAVEAGSTGGSMEWRSYTYDGTPLDEEDDERSQEVFRVSGEMNGAEDERNLEESREVNGREEPGTEDGEPDRESEATPEGEEADNEGSSEAESGEGEDNDGQLAKEEEDSRKPSGSTGFIPRVQTYDSGSKTYQVTFPDGLQLVSNVPEGYIGPDNVDLSVSPGARENMVLYRDDEAVEYVSGDKLTQPGHYRLELNGQSWSCTIADYIHQAGVYTAPAGMHFTSAMLNGELLELSSERYVLMEEDGEYQFVLEGQDKHVLNTRLVKDTNPPQVEVTVKGGNASIQYLSDDVAEIQLEKDGEIVEGFSGYSVTRPGAYRLTVLDEAGNEAVSQFTLTYQVNRYGVIAVVLIILLVIGGVVFVLHTKRTVKIR